MVMHARRFTGSPAARRNHSDAGAVYGMRAQVAIRQTPELPHSIPGRTIGHEEFHAHV